MIKAIIFDLDGTLLDTMDDLTNSVNYILDKNNLPLKTKAEVTSFIGDGVKKLVARCVPNGEEYENFLQIYEEFEKYYLKHCDILTRPYDGIMDILDELKHKYILGVISNKSDPAVKVLIEKHFPGKFEYIKGLSAPFNKKPHKDLLVNAMEVLNLSNNEILYIGDSEVDIHFSFNAKVQLISVCYGFRTKDFLIDKGAKLIANTPKEIVNILNTIDENYCTACGTELELKELKKEGIIPYCPCCKKFRFPSFSTAVSMIVLNKEETHVLLIEQYNSTRKILVAGYVNIGESLEHTCIREVKEETGLNVINVKYNMSEYHPKSKALLANFIVTVDSMDLNINEEIDKAQWYPINEAKEQIGEHTLAKKFLLNYIKKI